MARLKQGARQTTPNDRKRKQPEEEEEKKEEKKEEKGEEKEEKKKKEEVKVTGGEEEQEEEEEEEQGGSKRVKVSEGDDHQDAHAPPSAAVAQEESRGGDDGYTLDWSRFGEVMTTGLGALTGCEGEDATVFCDEPVDEEMVRVGLGLLNSLVGQPTSIAGPWTEDVAAGRARTKLVVEGLAANDMPEFEDAVEARIYRASPLSATSGELDRFELTYLTCEDQLQYVFVIDRVARRFVFVGECGSHPNVGTNDFIYNNSDGSGPGLLLDPTAPPTPTNLLFSAAQRFGECCLDQYH